MNYKINTFFSKEQCEYLIDFAIKNGEKFSYFREEENSWDCRRIYDQEYKEYVLNNILQVESFDDFNIRNINISLTRYYENRRLDLHLDKTSNYTTVISLTDDYEDGRFVLSNTQCKLDDAITKIHLGLGVGVTFEGNKVYHGVMPVKTGIRCALNVWMNNTDFEYYKLDKQKKLI